jgi:hypothetical protein
MITVVYFCGGAAKRLSRDNDEYASISVKLRMGRMLLCSCLLIVLTTSFS